MAAPVLWNGTLNTNEAYQDVWNCFFLMRQYGGNLDGLERSLADKYRVEANEYGDTFVESSTDVGYSRLFDKKDGNYFASEYEPPVYQQKIVVDHFRQCAVEMNNKYLFKRAWQNENVFNEMYGIMRSQLDAAKQLYEYGLIALFLGTTETAKGEQTQTFDLTTAVGTATGIEAEKLKGMAISKSLAALTMNLKTPSTKYNDLGIRKAIEKSRVRMVIPTSVYTSFMYGYTPDIFHDGPLKDMFSDAFVLDDIYWGTQTTTPTTADGTTHRAADHYLIRTDASKGEYSATGTKVVMVYQGDLLPKGTPIVAPTTAETRALYQNASIGNGTVDEYTYTTVHAYTNVTNILFKLIEDDSVRYLGSFTVETSKYNEKNHIDKSWLLWAYAEPTYAMNRAFITVKSA